MLKVYINNFTFYLVQYADNVSCSMTKQKLRHTKSPCLKPQLWAQNKLTSTGANSTFSPISLATSPPFDFGRSHKTTFPPCCARRSTTPLPKPEAPPVTKETAPCDFYFIKRNALLRTFILQVLTLSIFICIQYTAQSDKCTITLCHAKNMFTAFCLLKVRLEVKLVRCEVRSYVRLNYSLLDLFYYKPLCREGIILNWNCTECKKLRGCTVCSVYSYVKCDLLFTNTKYLYWQRCINSIYQMSNELVRILDHEKAGHGRSVGCSLQVGLHHQRLSIYLLHTTEYNQCTHIKNALSK